MITSDGSVVERAADLGITYFDTACGYMQGNNERMVGVALKAKRNQITLSTKSHAGTCEDALKDLDTSLRADHRPRRCLVSPRQEQPRRSYRRAHRRAADRQESREDPLRRGQYPQWANRPDPVAGEA
jgi:aryl-alcohol dehydrogenase-like predicted oxidoreductase